MINLTVAESAAVSGSFDPFFDENGAPSAITGLTAKLYSLDGLTDSGVTVTTGSTVTNNRYKYAFTAPAAAGDYILVATAGTDATGRSIAGAMGGQFHVTATGLLAIDASGLLTLADTIEGAYTLQQTLQAMLAMLAGATPDNDVQAGTTHFFNPAGSNQRVVITNDQYGNRSAVAIS